MSTKNGSSTKSLHLHDAMAAHVERGELPGLVAIVSRRDESPEVLAIGTQRVGGTEPMTPKSLFRISSMTKPMAAAVAMMLVEEGTLALDAAVERWLPELANRRVLRRLDGTLDDTVAAQRSITVRDVLTFRMGFGLVWGPPGALPVQRAAEALQLGAFGPPRPLAPPAPDEWMRRFATLPLMAQPGERWMYNTSAEVLGVLLARASSKPLDVLMRERLFAPLGMNDTSFWVKAADVGRLTTSYMANPETGTLSLYDEAERGDWSRPPAFPSAGAGLVSTAEDCLSFARMMLDGGARLLSETSVHAMTTDQISATQKAASRGSLDPTFWDELSWGMGLAVVTRSEPAGPRGAGWDGGLGTTMWWDPKERSIAVLMTQRSAYPKMSALYRDFWTAVNA